jgi:hypothetical protein
MANANPAALAAATRRLRLLRLIANFALPTALAYVGSVGLILHFLPSLIPLGPITGSAVVITGVALATASFIVGGGREAWSAWGRGSQEKLWARGPCRAWSSGPSTSPLGIMQRSSLPLMLSAAVAALMSVAASGGEEPVTAYTMAPSQVEERALLQVLARDYPKYKAIWDARGDKSVTYTVRQHRVELISPSPCTELPIEVTVRHGKLLSATYAASGGTCKKGQNVKHGSSHPEGDYLTPDALFQRVAGAVSHPPDERLPTVLRVQFDPTWGLPVKMEDYSEVVSDYYWSLEITSIRALP